MPKTQESIPFETIGLGSSTQQQLVENAIGKPECLTQFLADARTIQSHLMDNPDDNFGINIPDDLDFGLSEEDIKTLSLHRPYMTYSDNSKSDIHLLHKHFMTIYQTEPTQDEIITLIHHDFGRRRILATYRELILLIDAGMTDSRTLRSLIINPTVKAGASSNVITKRFEQSTIKINFPALTGGVLAYFKLCLSSIFLPLFFNVA